MSDSLWTEPGLDLGQLRQAIQEEYTAPASLACEVPAPLKGLASSDVGGKGPLSP